MNRTLLWAALAIASVGLLAATGCMSTGSSSAKETPKVWGYVTSAEEASLELARDQVDADQLVVDRVLAPGDAWIVVHADDNGMPGKRVGLAHISKGESTGVRLTLKNLETPNVIVAVHADRGTAKKFDFDMMKKEMSPDRPYFINGMELAKVVKVG